MILRIRASDQKEIIRHILRNMQFRVAGDMFAMEVHAWRKLAARARDAVTDAAIPMFRELADPQRQELIQAALSFRAYINDYLAMTRKKPDNDILRISPGFAGDLATYASLAYKMEDEEFVNECLPYYLESMAEETDLDRDI